MSKIDLDVYPYDEGSIDTAIEEGGCPGVGEYFASHPICVGDCVRVNGIPYRITAASVRCNGGTVYQDGSPGPVPPDSTHPYSAVNVQILLWLVPIPEQEYGIC